jgi:diguanylate cyclase (GGDEF)-like protein
VTRHLTPLPGVPVADASTGLDHIDARLSEGALHEAYELAESLCDSSNTDGLTRARAGLRLACIDLARSHGERTLSTALHAARQFGAAQAHEEEVEALSVCARAASWLGHGMEAIEAALQATALAERLPPGRWTVQASLALASAYGWARAVQQADRIFDRLDQFADRHGGPAARAAVEVERNWLTIAAWARRRVGREAPPALLPALRATHPEELASMAGVTNPLMPAHGEALVVSHCQQRGLAAAWSDQPDLARAWWSVAEMRMARGGPSGWMHATQAWLQAEMARQASDLDAAAMHASRLVAVAMQARHVPLALLGHHVAADIHAMRGRPDLALVEARQAMSNEQDALLRQMEGRRRLVRQLIDMRGKDSQIALLETDKDRYWLWAHEDELTGLANLRRFNQCLDEWLAASQDSGKPVCVAMIDVDDFSAVNNRHTHVVGDAVLKGIADLMRTHARTSDLPARWGGDEFAILFKDTTPDDAQQVADRFRQAVAVHDWSVCAPGLAVSVSVGVTQAESGDSKSKLIERADGLMYQQKKGRKGRGEDPSSPSRMQIALAARWLGRARRVVMFAGHAAPPGDEHKTEPGPPWMYDPREAFSHVRAFGHGRTGFDEFWANWRESQHPRQPTDTQRALVALTHRLPVVSLVTDRVDNLLTMAGAPDVIQLHGNAFRWSCTACHAAEPATQAGRCLACGAPGRTIRPELTLLGEEPDARVLADADLAFKLADVVIVVDHERPAPIADRLLARAKARGVRVVVVGSKAAGGRLGADLCLGGDPAEALARLAEALQAGDQSASLTDAGFLIWSILRGEGSTRGGHRLSDLQAWSNWEILNRQYVVPWFFPLTTTSRMDSSAPVPNAEDFRQLAADERARDGMRQAFRRMLRFYGFEWRDGQVVRAHGFAENFSMWVGVTTHHDLFLSRILGALRLCGLTEDARAFLATLEKEVGQFRGAPASVPLGHWRAAVGD